MQALRLWCGGWRTSRRMQEAERLPCLMGCGDRGRDDLQHYLGCDALWSAVQGATGVDQVIGVATRLGFGAEQRAHIAAAGVATLCRRRASQALQQWASSSRLES